MFQNLFRFRKVNHPWNDSALEFFFENLPVLLRHKEAILKNEDLYFTVVPGARAMNYRACLGDLVQLYDENGAWKINTGGLFPETLYIFHVSGSPFSGQNRAAGWNPQAKQIGFYSFNSLNEGVSPLSELQRKENLPEFDQDSEIPDVLKTFLHSFEIYGSSFCATKKQERNQSLKEKLRMQMEMTKAAIADYEEHYQKLEEAIAHCTDDRDKAFMLKNWQKLLSIHHKYHPQLFEQIVVSCFDIYNRKSKWGRMSGKKSILLSDLLDKWDNGFCYRGCPIVSVDHTTVGTEQIKLVCITSDGKLKTVQPENGESYLGFVFNRPECPKWSNRAVSDLYIKSKE